MASYYIATTGNDSTGTGTSGNPWLTISKAFSSSAVNDTINVAAGTYTMLDQTFTSTRTIIGAAATTTIFDGAAAAVTWQGSYIISNLTFTNISQGSTGAGIFTDTGGSDIISFTNCIFRAISIGPSGSTISVFAGASGVGAGSTSASAATGWRSPSRSRSSGSSSRRPRASPWTCAGGGCSRSSRRRRT